MKMTNRGNRRIYRFWAPVYDAALERVFLPGRRRALQLLDLQPGERVLIPGFGTGQDLPLLPKGIVGVGLDLSPEMLERAGSKPGCGQISLSLVLGDAQQLPVRENDFDAAILNLILSVVPDGRQCLESVLRALKPGGRLVVFDKFMSQDQPTCIRRMMNFFSTRLGTDINRRLTDMLPDAGCTILCDEASIAGGMYRVILMQKDQGGAD